MNMDSPLETAPAAAARAAAPAPRRPRRRRPSNFEHRSPRSRRRGSASLLAMLYLFIFAALALGFYAQTNVAANISQNEVVGAQALSAAESGMAFMRYQLTKVETQHLPESEMLVELANELSRLLDGTGNLENGLLEVGMTDGGDAIVIPRDNNALINLGNGSGFRTKITRSGRNFVVKVAGSTLGTNNFGERKKMRKGIEYVFGPVQIKAPLFDYGVGGRGQVHIDGKGQIRGGSNPSFGSVLTVSTLNPAVTMTGDSGVISGQVFYTNPTATFSYATMASIAGGNTAAHRAANTIHRPRPAGTEHYAEWPEFPKIDTSVYLPYVKRDWSLLSGTTLKNIRIPALSGTPLAPLKFGSHTTVEGVCYIESPNHVIFEGGCTIRGVIVGPVAPTGTLTDNVIEFKGSSTAYDMATLSSVYDMTVAANSAEFPPSLLQLTGSSVLAPKFHVKFTGGYASVSGTIVSDQLSFTGGAGGNITGYVFGLSNQKLYVGGSGVIQLEKPATSLWPAGVYFRSSYAPQPKTYREFAPRTEGM